MKRLLGLLAAVGLVGCAEILSPSDALPSGAVRMVVPDSFSRYWRMIDSCSGHPRPMSVTFYQINRASFDDYGFVIGMYRDRSDRIIYSLTSFKDSTDILHEMLHAHLRGMSFPGGDLHPPEYFQQKCGALVDYYRSDLAH